MNHLFFPFRSHRKANVFMGNFIHRVAASTFFRAKSSHESLTVSAFSIADVTETLVTEQLNFDD